MPDASGRRPDLLESLLGLCEPDDVAPAHESRAAASGAVESPRDVAAIVAGLQHPDAARRREALGVLAHQEPDLRALARISLTDGDDQVRAEATAVVATLGGIAVADLAAQVASAGFPRARLVALAALDALVSTHSTNDEVLALLAGLEPMATDPEPTSAAMLRSIGDKLGLDRVAPWRARFPRATSLLLDDQEILQTATPPRPVNTQAPIAPPQPQPKVEAKPEYTYTPPPAPAPEPAVEAPKPEYTYVPPPAPAAAAPAAVPPAAPAPRVHDDRSTLVLTSLAVALADDSEAVRDRASKALLQLDREPVRDWARGLLQSGTERDARLAVGVARVLALTELGAEVLRRAAEAANEDDPIYLETLRAWNEPAETTILHVKAISPSRRHDALRCAWKLHGQAILPYVSDLLTDSAGPVRTAALEILGQGSETAASDAAMRTLATDSSPSVRTTAVEILGRTAGPQRVQALHRALADPDPDVRAAGVKALLLAASSQGSGIDDTEAATLLLKALSDPEEWVWRSAVEQLATLADSVPSVVWAALRNGPPHQQEQLLVLLEVRRPERLGSIALDKLGSRDEDDRVLAVRLIGLVGTTDGVARVINALYDPSAAVRRAAADELSGLQSPEAVPSLTHALLDPDPGVRLAAVAALGVIDDDEVIPALVGALTDPNDEVRRHAASVISRWSSPSVARALVDFLTRAQLDSSAVDLLVGMGPAAVEPLMDALAGADDDSVQVLGLLLDRVVGLDALLEQARSLDPDARLRAVQGVGAIKGERSLELLVHALGDPHVPVRIAALKSLARIDDARALNAIRACRTMDPVAEVVTAADEALHEATTPAQAIDLSDAAVPAIEEPSEPQQEPLT